MKVLYWVSTESHKRMCVPMVECNDIEQAIVLPTSVPQNNIKLKKIYKYTHPNLDGVIKIIDKFKPDAFVQYTSSRYFVKPIKKRGIKHCFSAHGVWPDKSYNNRKIVADPFFQNFDLFLGANTGFKDTLRTYAKTKAMIATDALTQFDILYNNSTRRDKIVKEIIRASGKPKAEKVITLFGHKLSTKTDNLAPYDFGYYRTMVELAEIAKRHNWLIVVKPKGGEDRVYIKSSKAGWINEDRVRERYLKLSKDIKFLKHDDDPYKYLLSDVVITSARSTIEVEAALVKSPTIRIWTPRPKPNERQLSYEYGAIDFGAVNLVKDISKLEDTIISLLDKNELCDNQNKLIEHHGITFDGKAHIRFLDAIRKIIEG
jgi:hypothetical protein